MSHLYKQLSALRSDGELLVPLGSPLLLLNSDSLLLGDLQLENVIPFSETDKSSLTSLRHSLFL